jgi:hypothetical protein
VSGSQSLVVSSAEVLGHRPIGTGAATAFFDSPAASRASPAPGLERVQLIVELVDDSGEHIDRFVVQASLFRGLM